MAKNKTRVGSVRKRDQVWDPKNRRWTKRNADTGQFMDQKADKKPFKGVRKKNRCSTKTNAAKKPMRSWSP